MKKNISLSIYIVIIFGSISILSNSCEEEQKFSLPAVTTTSITNVTPTSALISGEVTSDGGSPVHERGFCWSTSPMPILENSQRVDFGVGKGKFSGNIGFETNTTYYIRAYATNYLVGTSYGNQIIFATPGVPIVTTSEVNDYSSTTAIGGGEVISDGGSAVTSRGICWGINYHPTINGNKTTEGAGIGAFKSNMSGLMPILSYSVRAYAINQTGIGYGNDVTFTTQQIKTTVATHITQTSAKCGGYVFSVDNGLATIHGVCWSTSPGPTTADDKVNDGTGAGNFTSNITGLSPNTTYYVRAYITNIAGTGYGDEKSFTTQEAVTVTDIDGNTYFQKTIGTQIWMAENLKVTKYNDGTSIPLAVDNWAGLSTPGYCWLENDAATYDIYGAFYNYYAVNTNKLCPTGWHVPSEAEWNILLTYLGGEDVAGGKMREAGIDHWQAPNSSSTNESGFTALPAGNRLSNGAFLSLGNSANWWSSSEESSITAWMRTTNSGSAAIFKIELDKVYGLSVRCLKD